MTQPDSSSIFHIILLKLTCLLNSFDSFLNSLDSFLNSFDSFLNSFDSYYCLIFSNIKKSYIL